MNFETDLERDTYKSAVTEELAHDRALAKLANRKWSLNHD